MPQHRGGDGFDVFDRDVEPALHQRASFAGEDEVLPRAGRLTSHDGVFILLGMRNEFTAIVERAEGWFIAYSPEIAGANGQGRTKEEALESLRDAIALILQDRREDGLRGVPADAERETVVVV